MARTLEQMVSEQRKLVERETRKLRALEARAARPRQWGFVLFKSGKGVWSQGPTHRTKKGVWWALKNAGVDMAQVKAISLHAEKPVVQPSL